MGQISNFRDLEVWQRAHQLVLAVYQATKNFPVGEKYGLVSQMRRAAVSIPANIAEGFKRRGQADKMRFYNTSETSLEELKYSVDPNLRGQHALVRFRLARRRASLLENWIR